MTGTSSSRPLTRRATLSRVALFWGAYFPILFLSSIPKGMVPTRWSELVWGLCAVPPLWWLSARMMRTEPRSIPPAAPYTLGGSATRVVAGALVGFANYAVMLWLMSTFVSPIRLVPAPPPEGGLIALTIAAILALAYMEELGFRGYTLRALHRSIGAWPAHGIVAVAFGLSHIAFGWDLQNVIYGVLPSALLFGAAAHVSGGLAMPTALHAAMNFARTATGERGTPWLWTISIDPVAAPRIAAWAPVVGVLVTLVFTGLLFALGALRNRRQPSQHNSVTGTRAVT